MNKYIPPGAYHACPNCGTPWKSITPLVVTPGDTLIHKENDECVMRCGSPLSWHWSALVSKFQVLRKRMQ